MMPWMTIVLVVLLNGCGQKGSLYLPQANPATATDQQTTDSGRVPPAIRRAD